MFHHEFIEAREMALADLAYLESALDTGRLDSVQERFRRVAQSAAGFLVEASCEIHEITK